MKVNNTTKHVNDRMNDMSPSHVQQDHPTHQQVKKSRGNRKLQRYRRKLRKQGIQAESMAGLINTWVNSDVNENNKTSIVKCSSSMSLTELSLVVNSKNNRQNNNNQEITECCNDSISINETKSSILVTVMQNTMIKTDDSNHLENISNETFR
jgi:hypothetical protein